MRSVRIGVTRCGGKCEDTVLLQTQVPCESVRKCSVDTVTDETSARMRSVTVRTPRAPHFRRTCCAGV